jgi:hypothetical protein
MAKRYGVEIDFYAVSCTANPDVCRAENLHAFPLIKLYGARNGTGTQVEAWRAHCFTALKYFGVDLPDELDQPDVAIPVVRERVDVTVKHVHDTRTKKQIFDDAFLSFDFAMRNSIYMSNGPLSNESASAFAKWIELLENTLPPTWKLHNANLNWLPSSKNTDQRQRGGVMVVQLDILVVYGSCSTSCRLVWLNGTR